MDAVLKQPTAAQCRALRETLGLSPEQMAQVAGLAHRQRWTEYESDVARELPDRYRWTMLMLTLDLHPTMRLVRRQEILAIDWENLAQEVAQEVARPPVAPTE